MLNIIVIIFENYVSIELCVFFRIMYYTNTVNETNKLLTFYNGLRIKILSDIQIPIKLKR